MSELKEKQIPNFTQQNSKEEEKLFGLFKQNNVASTNEFCDLLVKGATNYNSGKNIVSNINHPNSNPLIQDSIPLDSDLRDRFSKLKEYQKNTPFDSDKEKSDPSTLSKRFFFYLFSHIKRHKFLFSFQLDSIN